MRIKTNFRLSVECLPSIFELDWVIKSRTLSIPLLSSAISNQCCRLRQMYRQSPGGLADNPDFLRYMSLVENTAGPWFKLSVFGELGLNNAGRRAARENRKVFFKPFIHILARPSDCISSCRWRRKPPERNAELIDEQRKNKLGPRMTRPPRISLRISRPSFRRLVSQRSLGRL